MRVLYVNPMQVGSNAGVDVLGQNLAHTLRQNDVELRMITADFRHDDRLETLSAAVCAGIEATVDAIVVWVLDPAEPAREVAAAREAGIPVISLERPRYPVDASVVYPNFNHGVYMAEYLATIVEPRARVAVVGGPEVVDDIELMLGLVHGLGISGLQLVNDPEDPRYKNITDVAAGGREKTLNILGDFDHLDALIPYNDETMLGSLQALRETGRLGEMKMVSRNGTPNAVRAIRDGLHHGTWDLDIPGIGVTVGELVVQRLHGEDLDGLCVASPIGRMITPERAETWVPWEERIDYVTIPEGLD